MLAELEEITRLEREGCHSPCSFLTQAFAFVQPSPRHPLAASRKSLSERLSLPSCHPTL